MKARNREKGIMKVRNRRSRKMQKQRTAEIRIAEEGECRSKELQKQGNVVESYTLGINSCSGRRFYRLRIAGKYVET